MKVQDVMTKSPRYCTGGMNLAQATELLWEGGCGALPVIDESQKVIGILTDRDICIRLGTNNARPSDVTVAQAMSSKVATCRVDEEIHCALKRMAARKVRRLPVVSSGGKLEGMLCASELLLRARHDDGSRPELSVENVVSALRGICVHCPPVCTCA